MARPFYVRVERLETGPIPSKNGRDTRCFGAMLERMWHEVRLAWRGLRRAPGFSVGRRGLTFALGMAGSTSMFALVEGILLRPLAVPNEDRLVVGWRQLPNSGGRRWPLANRRHRHAGGQQPPARAHGGRRLQRALADGLVEPGGDGFAQAARVTGDFFRCWAPHRPSGAP